MTINAKRLGLFVSGAAIAVAVPLGIAQSAQAHGGGFSGPFSGPTRPAHVDSDAPTTSGTETTTATPTTSRTPCTKTTTATPTTSSTDTPTASASASASAAAVPRFGGRRH